METDGHQGTIYLSLLHDITRLTVFMGYGGYRQSSSMKSESFQIYSPIDLRVQLDALPTPRVSCLLP